MAQIPLGNFGNVLPQAQAGRVLETGSGQLAQSIGTLAQVGQQGSLKELNEQKKIQDDKEEYAFNIEASKYGADYTDVVTETKQKLATGEFDENSAKAYLRQKTDELSSNYKQTLPDTQHDKFNYYAERMFYESEANVKPLAYDTERRKINADFEQVGESTLKFENREQARALYANTVERNPVLTPEQRTQSLQSWDERRDLSDAKGTLNSLEAVQDVAGLQKVYDSVDTIFPYMKVETRDAYKDQIQNSINRINKGLQVEQEKRDKELKQLSEDFAKDALTGYPMDAGRADAVLKAVVGTEYEAEVRENLALNKDAQKFRNSSPVEQERAIARLTSELENTPQEDASKLQKQLSMFQNIANTSKQRAKDDPIASIQSQTGKKLYTVTPEQIGRGNIDFKQAQITTQMLADQKKKNGGIGSLIQWNTTERKAFTDRYFDATPKQQRAMLTDLTKMAGSNKDAQKEYFTLIGGEKNAYDYMGIAKLNQMDIVLHGSSIRAADVALEGKALLNAGQASVLGNEKQFHTAIQSEFGNASGLGGSEHRAYQNLAFSIYLGLAKRGLGIVKQDENGNPIINKSMAKQAFDIATGGTYKQALGKNTNHTFMPYGYTQASFEDAIQEHLRTQYRKETGYLPPSENILKTHAVVQLPNMNNWYMFIQPNGKPMINPKTTKPYVIKINNK